MHVFRALEWLSRISAAKIMDKNTKIGEHFCTHKPQRGWNTPLFYMANTRQRIDLQSCSNPLCIRKDL